MMGFIFHSALQLLISQSFAFNLIVRSDLEGWDREEVTFNVNYNSGSCLLSRVELDSFLGSALEVWNNVPNSRIKVKIGNSSTTTATDAWAGRANDYPLIICDSEITTTLSGTDTNNIPGVSLPKVEGARITGGTILLNSKASDDSNIKEVIDLNLEIAKVVVAHEVGHVLGLGHSDDINALMYFDASLKKNLRLGQDDMDGITWLYPRKEISGDGIFGCGALKVQDPKGGGSGLGIVALSWLWVFALAGFGHLILGRKWKWA